MSKPKRAAIGIDIGGTKTMLALFDEKFRRLYDVKYKTHIERDLRYFNDALTENLNWLLRKASRKNYEVVAAGIGSCGFVDNEGGTLKRTPVAYLQGYNLREYVSKKLRVPVFLGNDIHMGLYGEHQLGAATGLKNVIGVFIGTGIGAGLIVDGKLYTGTERESGDIGHYLIAPLGPLTGSENEGSLNDIVSRGALAGKAAMLGARNLAPHLMKTVGADVTKIRSSALADSIANGDKAVEEMVRSRAHTVGIVLSNLVDFLNPQMVVLGGGVVEAMPSIFLKEIEKGIRRHTVDEVQRICTVAVSKLKDHAVTTGAAKMAWDVFVKHD